MSPGTASISLYAFTPNTSARPGLTGRISPGKPCFCRKRCGREVVLLVGGGADQRDSFGLEQGVEQCGAHGRSILAPCCIVVVSSPRPAAARPARPCAGLAVQTHQARRALCARRLDRRGRPRDRRISRPAARPEHRGREPAGQRRQHRHVAGRQGGARRLHAAHVEHLLLRSRPRSTATSTTIRSTTSSTSRWPRSTPASWWSIRASRPRR